MGVDGPLPGVGGPAPDLHAHRELRGPGRPDRQVVVLRRAGVGPVAVRPHRRRRRGGVPRLPGQTGEDRPPAGARLPPGAGRLDRPRGAAGRAARGRPLRYRSVHVLLPHPGRRGVVAVGGHPGRHRLRPGRPGGVEPPAAAVLAGGDAGPGRPVVRRRPDRAAQADGGAGHAPAAAVGPRPAGLDGTPPRQVAAQTAQ